MSMIDLCNSTLDVADHGMKLTNALLNSVDESESEENQLSDDSEMEDDKIKIGGDGYTVHMSKKWLSVKPATVEELNGFRRHRFQSVYGAGKFVNTRIYQTLMMWAAVLILLRKPPKLPVVQELCNSILSKHRRTFAKGLHRLATFANFYRSRGPRCPRGLVSILFSIAPNVPNPQTVRRSRLFPLHLLYMSSSSIMACRNEKRMLYWSHHQRYSHGACVKRASRIFVATVGIACCYATSLLCNLQYRPIIPFLASLSMTHYLYSLCLQLQLHYGVFNW